MIVLTRPYAKLALTTKSGLWGADNQRGGVRGSLKRNEVQHHGRLNLPTIVSAASSYPSPNA